MFCQNFSHSHDQTRFKAPIRCVSVNIKKKKHFSYKINKLTSEQPILSANTDG